MSEESLEIVCISACNMKLHALNLELLTSVFLFSLSLLNMLNLLPMLYLCLEFATGNQLFSSFLSHFKFFLNIFAPNKKTL
jgi:hypothetical protein